MYNLVDLAFFSLLTTCNNISGTKTLRLVCTLTTTLRTHKGMRTVERVLYAVSGTNTQ